MGVGLFLGAEIGSNVVEHTHPTRGDVLDGARSLVPPGYQVTSEALDVNKGSWFATVAYGVQLEVDGGGETPEDRLSDVRQQAMKEGWQVEEEPGVATFLRFVRPAMLASFLSAGRASCRRSGPPA